MRKLLSLLLFLTVGFSQAPVTTANLPYYIGELYFNRTHLDSLLPADSSSIYIEGYTAMDSTGIDGLGFVPDLEFTEFKDAIDDSISNNVDSTFVDNLNFIPDLQLANVTNVATSDDAYDATNWDGNTDNATKNAIRDKIETLPGGHDPITLNANATAAGLSLVTQEISHRAATNSQTGYMTAAFVQNIETNNAKVTDSVPDSSDIDALNFVPDLELTDYLLKAADRDSNTVHLAFAVTGNTETGITVTAPGDGTLDFVVTGAPPTLIIRDGGTPITGTPSDLDFLGADFVLSDVAKSDSVEISIADSGIDHDQTTNFVAAEHYDWTQDLGATNIHSGNYNDTQLDSSGVDALNFIPDLELTNYLLKASVGDSITTRIDSTYIDGKNFVPDLELADYLLLASVGDTVITRIDSTYIDGKNFVSDLEFGNHTGTDHLFESELDDFSELQAQISDKTLVNEEDDFTITGLYVFSDSTYIDTLQFGIIYGGIIKSGTWNGTAISDSYIDNNITITNLSGTNTGDNDIMEGGVSVSTAPNYLDFLGADFNLSDGVTVDSVTIMINDGGINHDNTANYSANKHIDHTSIDFTAGDGLRGGGTIASNRTFIVNLDFDGGLETTDDSINVKLDGSTLAKGTSGLKVNSITVSLVSDFDAEVASNSAVAANTEKVTDDDIGVAEVYDITNWDADTGSPQKNDLRDYFASFDTDGDGDIDNFDATNLANAVSPLTLTALQIDNLNFNANTILSTAGTDLIITPLAGQDIILDSHWQFDGADLTALTDNNTIINAYSGKNITIEGVTFDNNIVTATTLAGALSTAAQTAITSVGALGGGSITNGFGAIDIGADNLTATGTVSLGATSFNDNNLTNIGQISIDELKADDGIVINVTDSTNFSDDVNIAGSLGIGITEPRSKLDIGTGALSLGASVSIYHTISQNADGLVLTNNAGQANLTRHTIFKSSILGGAITEKMRITGGGNVGINVTEPAGKLHVDGDFKLYDDITLSTDAQAGYRFSESSGDLYQDTKVHTGGVYNSRIGMGAESGAIHTWRTVSGDGLVNFPIDVTVNSNYVIEGYATGRNVIRGVFLTIAPGGTPNTNINISSITSNGVVHNPPSITDATNLAASGTSGSFSLSSDGKAITLDITETIISVSSPPVFVGAIKINSGSGDLYYLYMQITSDNLVLYIYLNGVQTSWLSVMDSGDTVSLHVGIFTSS